MKREDFSSHAEYVKGVTRALPKMYLKVFYNGFGASGWVWLTDLLIPWRWRKAWERGWAVRRHDVGYWMGGTPEDRRAVDNLFFYDCLWLCGLHPLGWWYAFKTWMGCRKFGHLAFEKRERPRTYLEMIELAQKKIQETG